MILAANIFSSSNNEDLEAPWLQNPWGKDTVASTKNIMNKGNFVFGHNMRVTTIATTFASLLTALKMILIYVKRYEKRNPTQMLMDMCDIRSEIFNFIILDRFSFCRASTLNLDRRDFVEL